MASNMFKFFHFSLNVSTLKQHNWFLKVLPVNDIFAKSQNLYHIFMSLDPKIRRSQC